MRREPRSRIRLADRRPDRPRASRCASRSTASSYQGFAGDTLASALLANGVRLVGRSFKYHRPRGILTAGPEEPNALVELRAGARREPNTRATIVELYDGLEAASQNRWPSLGFDLLAVNALFAPFLAAGFYYKTFMWPAALLGEGLRAADPPRRRARPRRRRAPIRTATRRRIAFCDVLVIGGGPAGLAAALAAGRAGARVILCDEDFALGGRLLAERREIDGARRPRMGRARRSPNCASLPDVRIMPRTTRVRRLRRRHLWRASSASPITAGRRRRISRASGSGASSPSAPCWRPARSSGRWCSAATTGPASCWPARCAATSTASRVAPGRVAVVFTTNDDGWRTACDLAAAGVEVAAIVDPRAERRSRRATRAAQAGARRDRRRRGRRRARRPRRCSGVEMRDAAGRTIASPAICSPCPAAGIRPCI